MNVNMVLTIDVVVVNRKQSNNSNINVVQHGEYNVSVPYSQLSDPAPTKIPNMPIFRSSHPPTNGTVWTVWDLQGTDRRSNYRHATGSGATR